jgi:cysteinyl-tRNA synthetase
MKIWMSLLLGFLLTACAAAPKFVPVVPEKSIRSFAYVIDGAQIEAIADSNFNACIIDYSFDGTDAGKYTNDQIKGIKDNQILPIAYLSIGEAEDYRFYWNNAWYNDPPAWLGDENPNWEGNYSVQFWHEDWQAIIFEYIDKIIEQGFEALMLDKVDIYYDWFETYGLLSEEESATRMIHFVDVISTYIKETKGMDHFQILSQNTLGIFDYDTENRLKQAIWGVVIEELFYYSDGSQTNEQERQYRLERLEQLQNLEKIVLVIDYVYPLQDIPAEFIQRARDCGFIPYAADSSYQLDELIVIEGMQPSN